MTEREEHLLNAVEKCHERINKVEEKLHAVDKAVAVINTKMFIIGALCGGIVEVATHYLWH